MSLIVGQIFQPGQMDIWSLHNSAAGAVVATASKAAGAAGVRHVAKRVGIKLAAPAAGQVAPVQVNLRDGATGAGAILDSWQIATGLSAVSAGLNCVNIDEDNHVFVGTAATAMTIEFASAPVAASTSSVSLEGYDLGLTPVALPSFTN